MCTIPNNSLLTPTNKYIKFYKEDVIVVEGANVRPYLSLSGLRIPYAQYFSTDILLKENTYSTPLHYGALGEQITFIVIKVDYIPVTKTLVPSEEIPHLEYFFSSNPDEVRNIDKLLLLTGTTDTKLPKIFLNNPNLNFQARVQILAATTDVTFEPVGPSVTTINDTTVNIQDLLYTNIISDPTGLSIIVQSDSNTPLANFSISNISNIEISGRLLIIDDTSLGEVNLFFVDEYNCLQAYSLINWAIGNPGVNIITSGMSADTLSPVITYANTFTTTISLLEYPNGTSGTNGYVITKQNLLDLLIDNVTDNRDGLIILQPYNLTITKINQTLLRDNISEIGLFTLTIDVSDVAGNKTTDVFILNITDNNPPKIILSTFGYQLYVDGTSGTAGFANQDDVYLQDFNSNIITKQNLLDIIVSNIIDAADGTIQNTTNNVLVTIKDYNTNIVHNSIDVGGFYDVYLRAVDSNNNTSGSLWRNINTELFTTKLSINIKDQIYIDLNPNQFVVVPDNASNFNVEFHGTTGQYCYLIFEDTYIVQVGSYIESSILYFVFDNTLVGNGKLLWDANNDIGDTKEFILNSISYDVKWLGFGSLLFGINTTLEPTDQTFDNYVVDEDDNFLSDENDNFISF